MVRVVWIEGQPGKSRRLGEDNALSADYTWDAGNLWTAEMADHDWKRLGKLWPGTAKEFATEAEIAAASRSGGLTVAAPAPAPVYEVWDTEAGNLIADYTDEDAATRAIREDMASDGSTARALVRVDPGGERTTLPLPKPKRRRR